MELLKNAAKAENPLVSREAVDQARSSINIGKTFSFLIFFDKAARINAPSTSAMAKTYQRAKRRSQEELGDRGLDALNPTAIIVPEYLNQFIILDENLLIENVNKRIFVFASPFSLELLAQYPNEIAIDGTFDVSIIYFIFSIFKIFRHHPVHSRKYLRYTQWLITVPFLLSLLYFLPRELKIMLEFFKLFGITCLILCPLALCLTLNYQN